MYSTLPLPTVESLCDFLRARFPLPQDEQAGEVPTLWRNRGRFPANTPLTRLTLALDFRALANASPDEQNALFLHRPFDLPADFWPDVPVFASHRGLDAHLSVGWNPVLAQTLALQNLLPVYRDANPDALPIGMIGDLPEATNARALFARLAVLFGGMEAVLENEADAQITRFAVMGAMTPALVRQASEAGAHAYLTGQIRKPAQSEAQRSGLTIYATGHKRAEMWGLRQLARELRGGFPGSQTQVIE